MNNKKVLTGIIIATVLIAGGGIYFFMKGSSTQNEQKTAGADKAIEDIAISMPDLDFSGSPLPDLNVSSLNVAAPQIPTNNIFSAPSVNTDFSYKPDLNISVPVPSIDFQIPSGPANIPSAPAGMPAEQQAASGTQPQQGGQPQIDCSVFISVPSCSYTGAPGSSSYEACKQCYPNK